MRQMLRFIPVLLIAGGVLAQPNEWVKVEANPSKGFHWPYYLAFYNPPATNTVLLVVPNDTPVPWDDPVPNDEYARSGLSFYSGFVSGLKAPSLAPVFPRPAKYPEIDNVQALDRPALVTKIAGMERIDLQLIAMIEDARGRLAARGITIDQKVWMMGGSAMGSFISRFTAIHPERVKSASIMSPGFGPTLPVAEWKGRRLDYPMGIADLKQLVGKEFDLDAYRQVPQFIWVGDEDRIGNQWFTPLANPNVPLIAELFGGPENYIRWPRYEAVFNSVGCMARFATFPGFGHGGAPLLQRGLWLWEIFSLNQGPDPQIFPKPMTHELYFPYIPSEDAGKTEISILNHDPELPVNGQWFSYLSDGTSYLETIKVTIPPLGRHRIIVGRAFQRLEGIGFLVFMSDSGFIGGYSTYNSQGRRFSVPAARANTKGELSRIPGEGWSRLALINSDNTAVSVRLCAIDDDGREIAVKNLTFPTDRRGGRMSIIGTPDEVFGTDTRPATHLRYSSGRLITVFLLGGSSEGGLLDGASTLPGYIRW